MEKRTLKKLFLTGFAVFSLGSTFAYGQTSLPPPYTLGDQPPPTSDRDPVTVNPFLDTLYVRLSAQNQTNLGAQDTFKKEPIIYYDLNNAQPFDPATASVYSGDPILLSATTTLRAAAYAPGSAYSEIVQWVYQKEVKNANPVVSVTSPANNSSITPGSVVSLTASASDPDGPTPLSVTYSRAPAGGSIWTALGTGSGSDYQYNWTVNAGIAPGTYTLRATATDGKGGTGTSDVTVTVPMPENQPPVVSLDKPAPGTYTLPATITLTASASDPDDASASAIQKVVFYQSGSATPLATLTAPQSQWTYAWVNPPPGDYTLKAVAYDNGSPQGVTTSAPVAISVKAAANKIPKVSITFPEKGKTYYAPFIDSVRATASDSDGNVVKVVFFNGASPQDSDFTPTTWAYLKSYPVGIYKFVARATDNQNGVGISDTVTFTVAANQAPIANAGKDQTIIWPANSALLNGSASSDPEGTALKYEWTGPTGVTFSGGNTATPTATLPGPGPYTVTLKVTDLGTPPASATNKMVITVNSKAAITSATTASGTAAMPFSYTLTASGYPLPALDATGGPAWLSFNASNGLLSGTPPAVGTFSVTLTANNGVVGPDSKTLTISISDSLTKPGITSPLSATAKSGTAFQYNITAKGNPAPTFTAAPLPAGLTLSGSLISGSPTVTGTYSIGLTATNSQGTDSKALSLSVTSDPKITANLDSLMVVDDKGKAVFQVSASGFPAVGYQWQYAATREGTYGNVGSNAASYAIDPVSSASAGFYRVIVKNGAGPDAVSQVCRLKVNPLPVPIKIVTNPVAVNAVHGDRVQFMVRATGEPVLLYQWFRGNTALNTPSNKDSIWVLASANTNTDGGIYKARVTNKFSDTTKPATYAWSDTARLVVQEPKLPKPAAKPAGTSFPVSIKVTLAYDSTQTSVYWTTNGNDPVQTSARYNYGDTLLFTGTATLKARAYRTGYRASDVMAETYTYTPADKVIKPSIKPPAPTFKVSMICTLSTTTPGATLVYTLDGSNPLAGNPLTALSPLAIPLKATTTITAFAKKAGMVDSDTMKTTYTLEVPPSKVQAPIITPGGGTFSGTLEATITCATDGALIWYTLDGSSPDTSSTHFTYAPNVPVKITKTTTLKAVATKNGFLTSDIALQTYKPIPGPITAQPQADIIFDADFVVKLSVPQGGAEIRYTLDGTKPSFDSPRFPSTGLPIASTTTVSAIAILDSVPSLVYSFSYTKKGGQLATPTPTTANNLSTFRDTLHISLYSTPGSDIYYTLNGEIPTASSDKYSSPIFIDNTVTLQAVAMQKGFGNSKILVATYTLVPEKPTASPPGGSSPTAIKVKLSCTSKTALIYYTVDGSEPTPATGTKYIANQEILISGSTNLKAVAVAGNVASPVMEESYTIFGIREFSLVPGQTANLEGSYSLRNPEDQAASVQGRIAGTGTFNLTGFDGVQYVLTLALADKDAFTGVEFPKLVFTSPSSDKRSMYKIDPSGKVYFISAADTVTLSQAGTYFMGIDIAPPVIRYVGESFDGSDSTRVSFQIDDNVSNLSYDLKRNDDPTRNLSQQFVFSGQDLSFKLKNPPGSLKPLYVQLIVTDYQLASFYPRDPGTMLSLSQKMGPLKGPNAWNLGSSTSLYDFISVPLALDPPLTLEAIRSANPGTVIEGAAWSEAIGNYVAIDGHETIRPGQAYWLGSRSRVSSLSLPSATTLPQGTGTFSVFLKHGWNQIANPHLEELWWPYSRNLVEAYKGFPIKGLWEYSTAIGDYLETESLKPWRGYYVYNYLEETTVNLSPRPVTVWAMKKPGAGRGISLSLGWGATRTLSLGADYASADALGLEDEYALPRRNNGPSMRAIRGGRGLVSDWIRLSQDGIQEWKIAMSGSGDSLPPLRILGQDVPEGYETWAVSPSRSLKFRVTAGREIPSSGLAQDTLLVFSGPKEKMAAFSLLRDMALAAPTLDLNVSAVPGGFLMRMALPSKARIRATVWGLDGTRKGELALGPLSEGSYGFSFAGDFRNRPGRLPPGMYFLSLEVQGQGLHSRLTRKIILQD
ncbi:MAG: hypothetical protein JWP91_4578 [Fibrobacteres bacterium]|nr:hypothetical protein [Fibrobacterota bacterium]